MMTNEPKSIVPNSLIERIAQVLLDLPARTSMGLLMDLRSTVKPYAPPPADEKEAPNDQ